MKRDHLQVLPIDRPFSLSYKKQQSPRLKSDQDRYPAIANTPSIALFVAVVDRLALVRLQAVAARRQHVGSQRQHVGVPVQCGGVRVWLARSLSATNFPNYPTNATSVGSDFDSSLPIHPILLP